MVPLETCLAEGVGNGRGVGPRRRPHDAARATGLPSLNVSEDATTYDYDWALIRLVPDDNRNRAGRDRGRRPEDVLDEGEIPGAVEHFRQSRLHSSALAGGKNHHVDVGHRPESTAPWN